MRRLIMCLVILPFVAGCAKLPTTQNPTNPIRDDPFILGPDVVPPMGCLDWQEREGIGDASCAVNYVYDTFAVHRRILAGFKYVEDGVQYPGSLDHWATPEDYDRVTGDCDDFAIACWGLLREKGHKPRLLFSLTEDGRGHLICVLGKMAIDNRQRYPVEIKILADSIGYTFISVSGREPGAPWRTIDRLDQIREEI